MTFPGNLYVDGTIQKGGTGAFKLTGLIVGTGLISGQILIDSGAVIEPGNASSRTLSFSDSLTLTDGSSAILDIGLTSGSESLRITSGTFNGTGVDGFTINLRDSGDLGEGSYTLLDWTGANDIGVELSDFRLGQTVAGFNYNLFLEGDRLRVKVTSDGSVTFKIVSIVMSGPGLYTITWTSVSNQLYLIETSTDLETWTQASGPIFAYGAQTSSFVTANNSPKRFWRVRRM